MEWGQGCEDPDPAYSGLITFDCDFAAAFWTKIESTFLGENWRFELICIPRSWNALFKLILANTTLYPNNLESAFIYFQLFYRISLHS